MTVGSFSSVAEASGLSSALPKSNRTVSGRVITVPSADGVVCSSDSVLATCTSTDDLAAGSPTDTCEVGFAPDTSARDGTRVSGTELAVTGLELWPQPVTSEAMRTAPATTSAGTRARLTARGGCRRTRTRGSRCIHPPDTRSATTPTVATRGRAALDRVLIGPHPNVRAAEVSGGAGLVWCSPPARSTLDAVFGALDFVYVPTDDVDVTVRSYVADLGAELVWKVRGMGTTVACVRVSENGPAILLAGHLHGPGPILVHRVESYAATVEVLSASGIELHELEIPHGPCASFTAAGGQRYAVYELVRPEAAAHFDGRIDP